VAYHGFKFPGQDSEKSSRAKGLRVPGQEVSLAQGLGDNLNLQRSAPADCPVSPDTGKPTSKRPTPSQSWTYCRVSPGKERSPSLLGQDVYPVNFKWTKRIKLTRSLRSPPRSPRTWGDLFRVFPGKLEATSTGKIRRDPSLPFGSRDSGLSLGETQVGGNPSVERPCPGRPTSSHGLGLPGHLAYDPSHSLMLVELEGARSPGG
jgi:hypothetical protein